MSSKVHSLAYPLTSETAAFRIIDNEAVILNLDSGIYYSLNEVGTKVWKLCTGSNSLRDITAAIVEEFEVQEDIAQKDVSEIISDLLKEGLVTINENRAEVKSN